MPKSATALAKELLDSEDGGLEELRIHEFSDDEEAHNDEEVEKLHQEFSSDFDRIEAALSQKYGKPLRMGKEDDDLIPLNGIFRFAIWSVGDRELFAAAAHENRGVPILLMLGIAERERLAIMEEQESENIPAAGIGDTDLAALGRTNPEAAKEIVRLVDLMDRGEETPEEFLRLCQLLFDAGSVSASEYLLRRNLDHYGGNELYFRLFGMTKQNEFAASIEAFKSQFGLQLSQEAQEEFLVSTFHSNGGPSRWDDLSLLSKPCKIKFGYIEEDKVEADIVFYAPGREWLDADECLLMYFVNGVWEIADPTGE